MPGLVFFERALKGLRRERPVKRISGHPENPGNIRNAYPYETDHGKHLYPSPVSINILQRKNVRMDVSGGK